MGRRGVSSKLSATEARKLVAQRFNQLTMTGGLNMLQLKAQLVEEEVIDFFYSIMKDEDAQIDCRLDAAKQLAVYARGEPKTWRHDGQTIEVNMIGISGQTIAQEVEQARALAGLHRQLDDLVRRQVPPAQWPADVRAIAGAMIETLNSDG